MQYLDVNPYNTNPRDLQQAVDILLQGGIVIYPTDTVYALGCLSDNKKALEKLAQFKNIKLQQAPLSFIFRDFSELNTYVKPLQGAQFKQLKKTLPGPYTYILVADRLPKPFHKRKTIGIRMVEHPLLEQLLALLPAPLVTSSIRTDDDWENYYTDPEEIFEAFDGQVDLLIAAGSCGNIPSTVIDYTEEEPTLVRLGKGDY
ncbi:MAG: L-threonylcarbamoyladenylate synthase [Flavobacteriaceae bacterium]